MEEMHRLIRDRIGIASEKRKTRYDATGHDFHEGDKVWLWNPKRHKGLSPKLQTNWEGYVDSDNDSAKSQPSSGRSSPVQDSNEILKSGSPLKLPPRPPPPVKLAAPPKRPPPPKKKIESGEELSPKRKKKCGRKPIFTSRSGRSLKKICLENRFAKTKMIKSQLQDINVNAYGRTVRRKLKDLNFKTCRPARKPKLTPAMKANRRNWAKQWRDKDVEFWRSICLLEDVPLNIYRDMRFQQDGWPAHYACPVKEYLNMEYPVI
ncbi:kinectin [Trichonephila clavipes]|uniref:Kinectin n=1 Tax=Trichonephila clavipes TaxID=2585209 RepID=A0A8X6VLN1_TRICX|nr:kinectin [Trichonephila clavipes]